MSSLFNGPGFLSARSTLGADISYLLAILFTFSFLWAGYLAKKGRGVAHHRLIVASWGLTIIYFVYYSQVRGFGRHSYYDQLRFTSQGGDQLAATWLWPALWLHFVTVALALFLAIMATMEGYRATRGEDETLTLKNKPFPRSWVAWGAGFIWLGLLLYWLFSHPGFSWPHRLAFLFVGYILPASIAWGAREGWPDPAFRHRALGSAAMALFALLFFTTSLVYYLLYFAL